MTALQFPGNAKIDYHCHRQLVPYQRSGDMSYQQKRFYLFNCDNTYSLETVEKLLLEAGDKYGFKISVDRLCFGLQRMAEVCDRSLPHLVMDYATLLFMQTNLVFPSTKTTLGLVTRGFTVLCFKKQVGFNVARIGLHSF